MKSILNKINDLINQSCGNLIKIMDAWVTTDNPTVAPKLITIFMSKYPNFLNPKTQSPKLAQLGLIIIIIDIYKIIIGSPNYFPIKFWKKLNMI